MELNLFGLMIGYPGYESINIGARGFYRAQIDIRGIAQHSGSSAPVKLNAATVLASIVSELEKESKSFGESEDFPMGGRISATDLKAEGHFTMIPNFAQLGVDCRLTPTFQKADAQAKLEKIVEKVKNQFDPQPNILTSEIASWPPYKLEESNPMVEALANAAIRNFNDEINIRTVGPSNIGDFLWQKNCPAICGFGVAYSNIHATDEYIELSTIKPVYQTYREAVVSLA